MKKLLLVMSLLPLPALAQVTVNTFTSGTPISASSMNTNFTNIKAKLDTYDASNADLFIFPTTNGTNGQVLTTNGSGTLSWTTPGGGGLSFPTPGSTGTAPNWSVAGSVYTLSIPMASATGVSAGLISNSDYANLISSVSPPLIKAGPSLSISQAGSTTPGFLSSTDWNNFNAKLTPPSGTQGQVLTHNGSGWIASNTIGPAGASSFTIKTNGIDRLTINPSGFVGVGTTSPSSAFDLVVNNLTGSNGIYFNPTLTGTSGHQVGLNVSPTINQTGATGYTGLLVNVSETSGGSNKILMELRHGSSPKLTVNHQGYFTTSGAFMGAISLSTACTPSQNTISINSGNFSADFGTISSPFSLSGLQEIFLDMPATITSTTITQLDFYLDSGTHQAKLVQGRNIKRLPSGSYTLKVSFTCAGTGTIGFNNAHTVFGIRRFH